MSDVQTPDQKKLADQWKARVAASEKLRKALEPVWRENVNFRAGTPFATEPEQETVYVNADAPLTRQKVASLFSQVPTISATPRDPKYTAAAPVFVSKLNHVLANDVKAHVVMEETLGDVVNASGIAAARVSYEATFEEVEVPAIDLKALPPDQVATMIAAKAVPMTKAKRARFEGYRARRISPTALLWDASFKGSDFEQASWLGWTGELLWSDAKREFNLTDEEKEKVGGGSANEDTLNESSDESDMEPPDKTVRFHELFYRCSSFDPNENDPRKLKRLVLVDGLDRIPVQEDYQGQRYVPQTRQWVGVPGYPIKILTLEYISDRAVPPSSSQEARPQVREQMRSRSQIILQRERSFPLRTYDTNRLDDVVVEKLRNGEWQDFIPVNGRADAVISEIARASYPPEDWRFQAVIQDALQQSWSMGDNQIGKFASGERSASEANIVAQASNTLVSFQRAKVARFFLSIAEAVAGLIVLFGLDSDEELKSLGTQGAERLSTADLQLLPVNCVFSIRPDSTVALDSEQRFQQLLRALNLLAKTGFVNPEPIIEELIALSGLDPAKVMRKPEKPQPEPPNFSARVRGEDLSNPFVVAMLQREQQITPEEIENAKTLILATLTPPAPPVQPQIGDGPVPPQIPDGALPPPPITPPPGSENWTPLSRITKRTDEIGG